MGCNLTWKISDSGKKEKNMRNKILIVEDEKLIQEELETLLSNAGFMVACVTDFENTLPQIKAEEITDAPTSELEKAYFELMKTALKAMTDEVSGSNRLNREFIEQWIHEMKVPITGIQLLCENNKSGVTRKILTQTEMISQSVERVLFYARLRSVEKDYT